MSRRLAREIAFKTLFQIDMGDSEPELALNKMLGKGDSFDFDSEDFSQEGELSPREKEYVAQVVMGCLKEKAYIDDCIKVYLKKWCIYRLSGVDRSLLRLAVYEIKFREDIPSAVSINEAIELAKVYQGEESASFINGVLDNISSGKSAI